MVAWNYGLIKWSFKSTELATFGRSIYWPGRQKPTNLSHLPVVDIHFVVKFDLVCANGDFFCAAPEIRVIWAQQRLWTPVWTVHTTPIGVGSVVLVCWCLVGRLTELSYLCGATVHWQKDSPSLFVVHGRAFFVTSPALWLRECVWWGQRKRGEVLLSYFEKKERGVLGFALFFWEVCALGVVI